MGFYIRKAINVGPFRFNLNKSGIGLSTGIKGFRIGTGPRGNYVHMGRGGIYFRQTLPSSQQFSNRSVQPDIPDEQSSSIELREIESASTAQMVDSSSAALLEEINSKSQKLRIWPWVLILTVFTHLVIAASNGPIWVYFLTAPLCIVGLLWAIHADMLRKTVVLFYELEPHVEDAYENLHRAFDSLRNCSRTWHIDAQGDILTTYDWKVNSGADSVVKRNTITPQLGSPPYFKCNISIPTLPAKRKRLYFLPDRVLLWDTNGVGAIEYEQLEINFGNQRFIESGSVPSDAQMVGKTWRYMNKKGGPDRRFNNNYEIPIMLYEDVFLSSKSGVRELFQSSRIGIGNELKSAVKEMASAISQREKSETGEPYIKCPCNNCEVFIEFPAHGIGQSIVCPHCGMETVLFKPDTPC